MKEYQATSRVIKHYSGTFSARAVFPDLYFWFGWSQPQARVTFRGRLARDVKLTKLELDVHVNEGSLWISQRDCIFLFITACVLEDGLKRELLQIAGARQELGWM